jgi:hypothetical protein
MREAWPYFGGGARTRRSESGDGRFGSAGVDEGRRRSGNELPRVGFGIPWAGLARTG